MSLNVELLENTFNLVEPRGKELAATFYEILFNDFPETREFFVNTDMEKQQDKLLKSLMYVVANLRYPEILISTLRDLGEKHASYGTLAEHYPIVGEALLKTLETYLGDNWTPEVEQAWAEAYDEITRLMLEGAQRYKPNGKTEPEVAQEVDAPKTPGPRKLIVIISGIVGLILILILGIYIYQNNNKSEQKESLVNKTSILG